MHDKRTEPTPLHPREMEPHIPLIPGMMEKTPNAGDDPRNGIYIYYVYVFDEYREENAYCKERAVYPDRMASDRPGPTVHAFVGLRQVDHSILLGRQNPALGRGARQQNLPWHAAGP